MASQISAPSSAESLESLLILEPASVGRVGLIVSDLQHSLDFYVRMVCTEPDVRPNPHPLLQSG